MNQQTNRVIFSINDEKCRLLPLYIRGAAVNYFQDVSVRKNGHPNYQLTLCLKGEGRFHFGGRVYAIHPGTVFFYSPHIPVSYQPVGKEFLVHWLTFDGVGAKGLFTYLGMADHWVLHGCPPLIEALFVQCHGALEGKDYYTCSMLLYRLLYELRALLAPTAQQEYPVREGRMFDLQAVLNQIEIDYDHDLSLGLLAQSAGVSESYLCRAFKSKTQMTPIEYLVKVRIQKSKELLVSSPALTIGEVAARVGFHDISYFCHVFKRLENTTPTMFRQAYAL